MTTKTIYALSAGALFCCAAPLSAFHPMTTEDTVFIGRDVKQAEIGFDHTEDTDAADYFSNTLSATFSYGLWDKLEILISAPWQGWNSAGLSESGLGDVALETKFWVAERRGWDLALKPGFSLPAGNDAAGLGAGKGQVWLYCIAGRAEGPRQYYLNAGYRYNRNSVNEETDIFSASAMGAVELLPKTLLAAELAVETNTDKSAASPPVSSLLGLVWSPNPSLDLDAGVRYGLNDAAEELSLILGATVRFGSPEKM
ncbi:MAG: transporter [Elusimicrobiales bacterium]|nr:transporter [Elusimicrobiales bacterium]